ncbi:hypothetical protein PIB30_060440 [Stylosanthes scabra]|uniref:Uncharacterized protein n=1 Tax=Stylosanthes scabra TaxID=79078 RepID=A0ABU6VN00_9FABA|nr:hypothetical protein [Stylosanthes scabra]
MPTARPHGSVRNSEPVARAAAGCPSNGTVARELKHYSQVEEVFSESDSAYSSAFETDIELPSSDSGTSTMGDLPRITLKQMGGASMALEN